MPLQGRVPLPPHEATDEPALAGCCQQQGESAFPSLANADGAAIGNVTRLQLRSGGDALSAPAACRSAQSVKGLCDTTHPALFRYAG